MPEFLVKLIIALQWNVLIRHSKCEHRGCEEKMARRWKSMVAARFELARDCSHRESRNLKSDALDQLGHATFHIYALSGQYICSWVFRTLIDPGKARPNLQTLNQLYRNSSHQRPL